MIQKQPFIRQFGGLNHVQFKSLFKIEIYFFLKGYQMVYLHAYFANLPRRLLIHLPTCLARLLTHLLKVDA
jgi:hypothetical protein